MTVKDLAEGRPDSQETLAQTGPRTE
jgi:hypothetical protein